MRWIKFIIYLILTTAFVLFLSRPFGNTPFPLGSFLSPFHGFWQNAVVDSVQIQENLELSGISDPVKVVFDKRRVPHIFASNEKDLAFVQGYVTARDRLWQMEFQIYAASGRLSELLGRGPDDAILNHDREMRRKGLGWAAERAEETINADPEFKDLFESYAKGVNAYIEELQPSDYPIEYKLLNYSPEPWTILKSTYLFKYMANMLASRGSDVQDTRALQLWGAEMMELIYPERAEFEDPVIPVNHPWFFLPEPSPPVPANYRPDSLPALADLSQAPEMPNSIVGSNNWAIHGEKTKSGKPILANDPHLGLGLPSIWYEVQLNAPGVNVYGASIPGAPGVVLGFNDSIAWGSTNAARDEIDFYQVEFEDETRKRYKINDKWADATFRAEKIKIKGEDDFIDSVVYTSLGPVIYDKNFGDAAVPLAMRWVAHDPSNDAKLFYLLNKAKNYTDYREALKHYVSPAQNFVFASAAGDIAISQQGRFAKKWKGQGRYILNANNSEHHWQGSIPFLHNPYVLNPPRGFVSSANQMASLEYYPYYYRHNTYEAFRNRRINWLLRNNDSLTVEDMKRFQLDTYGLMVEQILPTLLSSVDTLPFNETEKRAYRLLTKWNKYFDHDKIEPSIYQTWWDILHKSIWKDEIEKAGGPLQYPGLEATLRLLRDSTTFTFFDNIDTPEKEDRNALAQASFQAAIKSLTEQYGAMEDWQWYKINNVQIKHLLRTDAMKPFHRTGLKASGGRHILNATSSRWGPSWRMVVELGDEPVAYGIYPGGQTGNPADPDYDAFIEDWAAGVYYKLWFMKDANDRREAIRSQETFLVGKEKKP